MAIALPTDFRLDFSTVSFFLHLHVSNTFHHTIFYLYHQKYILEFQAHITKSTTGWDNIQCIREVSLLERKEWDRELYSIYTLHCDGEGEMILHGLSVWVGSKVQNGSGGVTKWFRCESGVAAHD